ncbi:MAG: phosphoribosyltransferase family protein [Pseudomonadota bacterium]
MAATDKPAIARQIKRCARLEGTFTLRSGAVSDTYFDKYRFEADPPLLKRIGEAMLPLIPNGTTVLAGLELGGIPLVTMLGQLTGLPTAFVRKAAKTYGTCRYAEGAELQGEQVLIVEDVVSSGGAILDTLAMLRDDGIRPASAICVIDRQSGGLEALAEAGVRLTALYTMADIESA